jgi:cell division protease FtsH
MIMRFGMSKKLGPRVLGRAHDQPFLGREYGAEPDYSEQMAREIDDEVRRVIEEAHEMALNVLREHIDELKRMADLLVERETIDKNEFERLLAGESEDAVFADTTPPATGGEGKKKERKPKPRAKPYPVPGALSKPPPPEGAKG